MAKKLEALRQTANDLWSRNAFVSFRFVFFFFFFVVLLIYFSFPFPFSVFLSPLSLPRIPPVTVLLIIIGKILHFYNCTLRVDGARFESEGKRKRSNDSLIE